ncbi:MAG: porin family protein [Gemmatimonadota bacterium]
MLPTSWSSSRIALVAMSTLALVLPQVSVEAQIKGGVMGGASITNFTGIATGSVCDPDTGCASATTSNRIGLQLGGFLQIPISGMWSFQPELHFIQKGGKTNVSISGDEFGDPFTADLDLSLAYLEVPALLRLDLGSRRLRPFFVAGPSVALRVGCDVGVSVDGLGSVSTACDEGEPFTGEDGATVDDPIKKFDVGGIIGAGVSGLFGGRTLSAQVRYARGFVNVLKDSGESASRNTGVSILFGVGF